MNSDLTSWELEETNNLLSDLAACWANTSLTDHLLGFSNTLNKLQVSLSGCHSLSIYASLSEISASWCTSSQSPSLYSRWYHKRWKLCEIMATKYNIEKFNVSVFKDKDGQAKADYVKKLHERVKNQI